MFLFWILADLLCWKIRLGEETDVWKAQKDIRERLNMRQIYYNGVPQRYFWLGRKESTGSYAFWFKIFGFK